MTLKIKLARIDKRLLHATVALNWNVFIDVDTILLVSPEYVEDPFVAAVMQLCLPKSMKVKMLRVEEFMEYIRAEHLEKIKAMVIFSNLTAAYQCFKQGFYIEEIQMPYPASRVLLKNLEEYFSETDLKAIREMQQHGIKFYFQTAPLDNKDYSIFKERKD